MSAHIVTSSLFCLVTDVINIKIQAFMKFVEKHQAESVSADNDIVTERARVRLVSTARTPPSERAPETPLHNKKDRRHQLLSAHSIQQHTGQLRWPRGAKHISLTGKVFNHSILCADRMTSTNILFLIYYFHILLN